MEENNTSWKNHSFTLVVFGGIVVLCSIFFVLGMLVGRNQGQKMAQAAIAEEAARTPVAASAGEEFKLNYYSETTEDKPDLTLQPPRPAPPAPAVEEAPASGGSSTAARADLDSSAKPARATARPAAEPTKARSETATTPAKSDKTSATVKPATSRISTPKPPAAKQVYLQVLATKNEKQAQAELKKVQLKGFKAKLLEVTAKKERWFRVYVGPYKESDVNLAKSDLKAKGYKEAFVPK